VRKYQTFIGFRFLRARLLNLLSMAVVAVIVWALLVVLCVMWGFDRDFRARIRGTLSTITVDGLGGDEIDDWEEVAEEVKKVPGVKACAPFVDCMCLLQTAALTAPARVRGVDLEKEKDVGLLGLYLKEGGKDRFDFTLNGKEPEYPGAVPGRYMCQQIGVMVGDKIRLIPPTRAVASMKRSTDFVVVGEFNSGWQEHDIMYVYVPIEAAQALLYIGDAVSGISVEIDDPDKATEMRNAIRRQLKGEYRVQTWEDQRRNFLQAIALERRVQAVIMGVVALLAGVTILVVITMTVKEKTRDIGIIKACGGTTLGIMTIFLLNGLYVGLIGAGVGLGTGMLALRYINELSEFTGLAPFPKNLYYIEKMPVEYNVVGICWIVGLAIVLSVVYAFYPAWRASRLNPVEALRYE
jgi:lipoprotein-releasing system permease protein